MTALAAPAAFVPSGRMIHAVLQFADLHEDLGDGRTCLRFSKARLRRPEVRAALGPDARRAAEVAVIYDEREAEIVDVAGPDARSEEDVLFDEHLSIWGSQAKRKRSRRGQPLSLWG